MTSLYRKVVISRLLRFISKNKLDMGGSVKYKDGDITLWSNNKDLTNMTEFIADFHKSCHKINAENYVELKNDGKFLGVIRSEVRTPSEIDTVFSSFQKITGIVTFAFSNNEDKIFFVPGIFVYYNDVPHILVTKYSLSVGHYDNNEDVCDDKLLVINAKEDFIEEIYKYAFNILDDTDYTMANVFLELSNGKYHEKPATPDIENKIERLGFNSQIVKLLDKFYYTPLVKLNDGHISDIVIQEGPELKVVNYTEFCTRDHYAVILKDPKILINIIDLDEDIYSANGKNYYVDDTEWKKTEEGGYRIAYRVVAEKKVFSENNIGGVIVETVSHLTPKEENFVVDAVKKSVDFCTDKAKRLIAKMKQNKEDKRMYKIFAKEVLDGHVKMEQNLELIGWSSLGGMIGKFGTMTYDTVRKMADEDPDQVFNIPGLDNNTKMGIEMGASIIATLIAYLNMPKKQETEEGIQMIHDYYSKELNKAKELREKNLKAGNVKDAKELRSRIDFLNDMLDRINRELERREEGVSNADY